jgi:hypothetical protein
MAIGRTFEDGYRDGWESVAAGEPLPECRAPADDRVESDYKTGFQYGKSEALTRFEPGSGALPPKPV